MKRMVVIASLCLMLFGMAGEATAQFLSDTPDMKGRWVFGGNIGGGIWNNTIDFSVAPQVGYRIFSPWEVGLRGVYELSCDFNRYYGNTYYHYFGLAPYTNYEFYKGLFFHVEDEVMYGFARRSNSTVKSQWFNSVFVGGGYRQYSISGSFVYLMVLYNLSWDVLQGEHMWDTPYASPIVLRVGFCF